MFRDVSASSNVAGPAWDEQNPVPDLSISGLLALCRRHSVLICIWVTVLLGGTVAVVLNLEPRYRAESTLMLDTRIEHVSDFKSVVSTPFTTQDAAPVMRSEVQLLTSPDLAGKVIDKLDLAHNPSFIPHSSRPWQALTDGVSYLVSLCSRTFGSVCHDRTPTSTDATLARIALIDSYLHRLSVFNDGKSFTLSVSFESVDPKLAALIANTHAELYLAEQREFKQRASVRGVAWVDQQIARLGVDLDLKEQELARFRETSGLVAAQGSTMVAQQVTQIDLQLAAARADLAERQARLTGAQGAARNGSTAAQSDVLKSPLIQRLREQQATALQNLADESQRHGSGYPGTGEARARADEINRAISRETERIVAANDGDITVAQQRVAELERTLETLRTQLVAQDRANSRFTEMERDVSALRVVYQGLLGRQQELEAQAGTEDADARLISSAMEPLNAFFPNKTMILGVALILAGASGVGLAYAIDRPGRGIEFPERLHDMVGLVSLQALPLVTKRDRRGCTLTDMVIDDPKAEFAEAIRSLRGDIEAIKRRKPFQVLAITSALPQEGKTTIAVALARSLAVSGLRVLLVDCDLRRPRAAAMVGGLAGDRGIVAVLQGKASLEQATMQDPRSALRILPVDQQVSAPQDLLGGSAIHELLATARARYDIVVLDTPPLGAVSDSLLIAERADASILLVRWKSTPASIVRSTLQAFERRGVPLDGIFLNCVDRRSLTRYDVDLRRAYQSTRAYYLSS